MVCVFVSLSRGHFPSGHLCVSSAACQSIGTGASHIHTQRDTRVSCIQGREKMKYFLFPERYYTLRITENVRTKKRKKSKSLRGNTRSRE